ncbi:hypothetical protein L1987_69445 [Smallanthus sonchifolius]|uniref:Uncharacterized protein n=1 Tax=Smallanthus sonchifolius TaxID=185202 RepID=A0ACB9B7V6_9ASTR|nr:hypothetical protein L1987_69445 [Smallanthus sonchifolius]
MEADLTANGERSSETKDGSAGQDNVQEDDSTGQHHVHEDGEERSCDVNHKLEKVGFDKSDSRRGDVDTTAPFESVKEAVTMFSGIVDWKAHKIQIAERRKRVAQELRKANDEISLHKKKSEAAEESKQHVLKELENAKRRLEELKLNLENAQTEESQAKQDAELTKLRVEEIEQGVTDESSVAAKAQLEVAQARHQAAVSELETVKLDLKNLQNDYTLLVSDRDLAIQNAQEAVSSCTETEITVEDLTFKVITTKEALESAHGAYLEAEEHRTGVAMETEQEEEVLKKSEEWEKISQQTAETEDLKSKLDTALVLHQDLKEELASYMEEGHKDIQSAVDLAKIELQEVKVNIENATDEVKNMKLYATSLNMELEQEKATFIKQNEGTDGMVMASIEADLMRTISELIEMNEKEARMKTVELPKQLEMATEEAEQTKTRAKKAQAELQKAKEAAKEAKKRENTTNSKLNAAVRGVEAARASERLAHGAVCAVEESEWDKSSESEPESEITVSVENYYEVSRKAKEAEDEANGRVSEAISQIDIAKESEQRAEKKLEQVKSDLVLKKEELLTTKQKAEKAKEGKIVVERELRIWRSENEQRRKANAERKKKKRSLIPRICMFLCRKKGRHSNKNNT